jgi:hypothetical protein
MIASHNCQISGRTEIVRNANGTPHHGSKQCEHKKLFKKVRMQKSAEPRILHAWFGFETCTLPASQKSEASTRFGTDQTRSRYKATELKEPKEPPFRLMVGGGGVRGDSGASESESPISK